MKNNENVLRSNFIWNSIGNFTYLVCQWLITVIIVRLADYREAGVFSLAMSITNTFYAVASWGIRTYQVSDVDNKYRDNAYIYSRYITCILAIGACGVFTILNRYDWEQSIVIIIYMFFRAVEAYIDVIHGIDQKADRMDVIGKSFLVRGVVLLLGFTLMLVITGGVLWSVVFITVSSVLVCAVYDIPKSRKMMSDYSQTSYKEIRRLLLESLPLVIYTFLMTVVNFIPRYFLEKIDGSELLGIYASIATPAVIVQAAASYIMAPFITPIAGYVEKKDVHGYNALLKKMLNLMFFACVVVIVGAYFFKDIGLKMLFGEEILQYSGLFMPVIFCTIATAFSWFINMLLTIYRDFKGLLIGNFMGVLCSVVISYPLITIYGLNGASIALLIAIVLIILISLCFLEYDQKKNFKSNKY